MTKCQMVLVAAELELSAFKQVGNTKEPHTPKAHMHTLIWFATSVNWRMMALTKLKPDNI